MIYPYLTPDYPAALAYAIGPTAALLGDILWQGQHRVGLDRQISIVFGQLFFKRGLKRQKDSCSFAFILFLNLGS